MSKATKQTKATTQVTKAVEEPVKVEQTKTKVVEQAKVVEQPKVELKHETDHEEEQEVGERKKKAMTFETSAAADTEIENIDTEMLRLSKLRIAYEKERKKLLTKEMRQSRNKRSDRPNKAGSKSGFNKPQAIPEHIRNFLNTSCKEDFRVAADDLKPRTWITKAIYSYIHDNKLTAENNGRKIIANQVLAELFGVDKGTEITFESFQTMVSQAFKLGQVEVEDEDSGSGEEVVEVVKKAPVKVANK